MRAAMMGIFLLLTWAGPLLAQPAPEPAEAIYYVIGGHATLFGGPDGVEPLAQLSLRDPVTVLGHQGVWSRVRTNDGRLGYVASHALSNVWIRVSKSKQALFVYRGVELVKSVPADFGYNPAGDKVKRGSEREPEHWRTPEGVFFVCGKNPNSQYYKSFVLNYPTPEHAARGLQDGLINRREYDDIVRAAEEFATPPMNTALGGHILIHGHGTGERSNWTKGCVAITDEQMDALWHTVQVGTPVLIEP